MSSGHRPFPRSMQEEALNRQGGRCASCGLRIGVVGLAGRSVHFHREGSEGHHVIPHKMGGPIEVQNCVVLCKSCHYSAHQGGWFGDVSIYKDIEHLPMPHRIATIAREYPYYNRR